MPEDYELEEVNVDEVDDDEFHDEWGEPEWDDDEKMILVFLGGAVLAWLWLTRPKPASTDSIYTADLERAQGPIRR